MKIIVTPLKQFEVTVGEQAATLSAFKESPESGLLELLRSPSLRSSSESTAFWYEFVHQFMRSFCVFSDTDPLRIPFDEQSLKAKVQSAPMVDGSEYITFELLQELWLGLEKKILRLVDSSKVTPRQYIDDHFAEWQDVGKIHFHLAENRKPDGKPFIFLSTYSVRIPGKVRVQHRPLGAALQESVGERNHEQLERILSPIYKSAKKSTFIRCVVENKSIFAPIALSPNEAFQFIRGIPHCEESGVVCKLPDWWHKNGPVRAKVSVKIGNKKQSKVGFDELLDFEVGVSVGNNLLSKADLNKILASEGPLVELGGKWVEVDHRRIHQMLAVWNKAIATTYREGIGFSQAMRMLSGLSSTSDIQSEGETLGENIENDIDWLEVSAGKNFADILKQIRSPEITGKESISAVLTKHLKGTLRPYQYKGVSWLNSIANLRLGGCLADDMGLGKTIQILALLVVQKHHFKVKKPSLLVVPASLIGNWQAEIQRFTPSLKYRIIHRSSVEKLNLKITPKDISDYDVFITTYGMVLRQDWLTNTDWQIIVADEAQAIKNASTKQSKAMRSLQSTVRIAMTGTPVENSLGDLWSIFDFSCPGLLGSSSQFKSMIKSCSGSSRSTDYGPLRKLISPYLLRRKKTDKSVISDLPDKIEMVSDCYLTTKQASLYQKNVKFLESALADSKGIARKGLVLSSLMRFKQICNHPSQYLANNSYTPALSGKFTKIKELVETIAAKQEKVLVFTQFRELTDILAHYLGECFGRQGLVLHGGTSVKKRQELVDQFQLSSGPPFFILSLKAGGTGLNLTAASHVIHFDRWWNPAVENQATDRAFRIGQQKNVIVHKFVCKGTIEEKIDAMIRDKKQLSDALIEGSKEMKITELSDQELLSLVKLDVKSIY